MTIEIYKDDYRRDYVGKEISGGVDAVIDFLRKKIKRNKCAMFTYCWDEDGNCAMSNDEEARIETDAEKMLSMAAERIAKFGHCAFGCGFGEVVVKDYSNPMFIEKIIAENQSFLARIKSK